MRRCDADVPWGCTSNPQAVLKPGGTTVEVRDVLQRSLKYETLDLEPPKDYVFTEDDETRLL